MNNVTHISPYGGCAPAVFGFLILGAFGALGFVDFLAAAFAGAGGAAAAGGGEAGVAI
jgi:hypothetical protein